MLLKGFASIICHQPFRSIFTQVNFTISNTKQHFAFSNDEAAFISDILDNFKIHTDFVTDIEEKELMKDVEPKLKRQRYQFDHWDDAIHGFRETETVKWTQANSDILKKLSDLVFSKGEKLPHTHILDLAEDGYIKPHVDSVRYCGDTIAGISLLSHSVMRLVHTEFKERSVDIYLPRLSLYIMNNSARYNYTHEILDNKLSYFNGEHIKKSRRVSIICRSPPSKKEK